jgi:hypothetical protein
MAMRMIVSAGCKFILLWQGLLTKKNNPTDEQAASEHA